MATTSPATLPSQADRIAVAVIAALAGLLAVLALADGVWRTVALAIGNGPVDLIVNGDVTDNIGRMTTATVASGSIDDGARTLLVVGSALALLVATAISLALVTFLVSTVRGTPFHRHLYPLVLTTGAVMSIGGMLAAGIDGLGRMIAGGELGAPYIAGFELHLGPWAFGFVVIVAAYVIRAGGRLQRDTEGLV